jgi:hypothetical protein
VNRALGLLLLLRLKGWLRRFGRSLSTLKGAALTLLGMALFVPWLISLFMGHASNRGMQVETVRRSGPLLLVVYSLITLLLSSGERAIYFSPAEVNLLFPGPFSRRQLLAYKITASMGLCALSATFMTVFMNQNASWWVAAYIGLFLALAFMQLFAMAVALVHASIGAVAFTWQRRAVLSGVLVVLGLGLWQVGGEALMHPSIKLLVQLEQAPVVQIVLAPFRWFILAFTAERVWPDLVQWAGLSLVVDVALAALVLALDAQYLEAAAASSARIYARIEQMRRGRTLSIPSRTGKPKFSLPPFPWWGGAGPTAWRQLTTASRDLGRVVGVALLCGMMTAPTLIMSFNQGTVAGPDVTVMARSLSGAVLGISLIVSQIVTFDFKGDLDRIEVLKTLPIAPRALALGQLAAPVVLMTGIQWIAFAVITASAKDPGWFVVMAAFAIPFNTLLCALENLLFLWFPVRVTTSNPADIQNTGRMLLLMFAKVFGLGLASGCATLAGFLAYLVSGQSWIAAGVACWVVLSAMALALVPLIAHAFCQFDVTRDTPA